VKTAFDVVLSKDFDIKLINLRSTIIIILRWLGKASRLASPASRTVHETFALIRLLGGAIPVMDTSLRFNLGCTMRAVVTLPVQDRQVSPVIILMIRVGMVNFHQVARTKV
jgi:hypothetical protein